MRRFALILAALALCAAFLVPGRRAAAVPPYACFYHDANYGGYSLCVNVTSGWRNFNQYPGGLDNNVSSVKVFGARVYLASGLNGNNYELVGWYTASTTSYVGATWNDRASSFYIGYL